MVQMGSRPQAAMRRGGPSLAASSSRRQLPSSVLCARILDRPACISFSESPRHISSAFVLALFVLADGWYLLVRGLALGYA